MPPKEKVTKEDILNKAFEMTKQEGFESITTRKLAQLLGCSTQPIFRVYENMEMLKKELYLKTGTYFALYMQEHLREDVPLFLSMGLAYVEFARKENYLFKFLSASENYALQSLKDMQGQGNHFYVDHEVPGLDRLSDEKREELFVMVWIFTHGMASMIGNNKLNINEEEIKSRLSTAYLAFAAKLKEEK